MRLVIAASARASAASRSDNAASCTAAGLPLRSAPRTVRQGSFAGCRPATVDSLALTPSEPWPARPDPRPQPQRPRHREQHRDDEQRPAPDLAPPHSAASSVSRVTAAADESQLRRPHPRVLGSGARGALGSGRSCSEATSSSSLPATASARAVSTSRFRRAVAATRAPFPARASCRRPAPTAPQSPRPSRFPAW
jgi:hypothetical protein